MQEIYLQDHLPSKEWLLSIGSILCDGHNDAIICHQLIEKYGIDEDCSFKTEHVILNGKKYTKCSWFNSDE